jgi:sporulation protein YlmC with PRC-barrel domain
MLGIAVMRSRRSEHSCENAQKIDACQGHVVGNRVKGTIRTRAVPGAAVVDNTLEVVMSAICKQVAREGTAWIGRCLGRGWTRRSQQKWPRRSLAFGRIMMVSVLLVAAHDRALSQAVELVKVDVAVVEQGYRASSLMGSTVTNDKDERIGKIDDLVIGHDKHTLFAVLQVGGFLGIGGRLVAVPYETLVLSEEKGRIAKIVLPGATKEALMNLAEFKYAS